MLYYCNVEPGEIESYLERLTTLFSCFDTVDLVIRPVKDVSKMTDSVSSRILNYIQPTQPG